MIKADKTRVILDGKVADIYSAHFILRKDKPEIDVLLYTEEGESRSCEKHATLLGIDSVSERIHYRDPSTETWTQFICETKV